MYGKIQKPQTRQMFVVGKTNPLTIFMPADIYGSYGKTKFVPTQFVVNSPHFLDANGNKITPDIIIMQSDQITSVINEKGTGTGMFWDIGVGAIWGIPSAARPDSVVQYNRNNVGGEEKFDISSQQTSFNINFVDQNLRVITFDNAYTFSCMFETSYFT